MIDVGECLKMIDMLRFIICVCGMNLCGRYGGEDIYLMNLMKVD